MVELIRLGLSLTGNGFKWYENKWVGKETKNSYIVRLESELWDKNSGSKRVKKEDLYKSKTNLNTNILIIGYSLWCFPDEVEKYKTILYDEVVKEGKRLKERADKMFVHLEGK